MKVVVDTNVLVSGIFWGGKPAKILECWRDDIFHLLVTPDILDEYLRILKKLGHSDEELVVDWTDYITAHSLMVLKNVTFSICRDSSDNKFLECALSADADCIVSGDDDLLDIKAAKGIPILTPAEFLCTFL